MLKVLKGSRILVDCETGDLHMDMGDGQCKPLGGGGVESIVICNSGNLTNAQAYRVPEGTCEKIKAALAAEQVVNVFIHRTEIGSGGYRYRTVYTCEKVTDSPVTVTFNVNTVRHAIAIATDDSVTVLTLS